MGSAALFDDDLFELDTGFAAASQTQQVLFDTHEKMGVMLDIMPIGMMVHTSQGILFANKAAAKILDITQEAAVGNHILDFLPDAFSLELNKRFDAAFTSSKEGFSGFSG